MSALSGITVSADLASRFADAVQENKTRFIKVSIQNESLVHDLSLPMQCLLHEDLAQLQSDDVLQPDTPAYILAKADLPSPDWISFNYVPDNAKVREKMLYASSRLSLIRGLGSSLFTDSIFATSKADLTSDAYAAHLRHVAAPNPLSSREQELASLRAAENAAISYKGSQKQTHVGTSPGFRWTQEAEDAVVDLGSRQEDFLLILTIDQGTESIIVHSTTQAHVSALGSYIPSKEPCYAIFSWSLSLSSSTSREIIFIYSCPSDSAVKPRMVYASGARSTHITMKNILTTLPRSLNSNIRRIETSDPNELNEDFLKVELGLDVQGTERLAAVEPKAFAKPKGPPRRR